MVGVVQAMASPEALLDMAESVNMELSTAQISRGFNDLVTVADDGGGA